ncbi:RagB/SusD family nutrient uptake outer membrane protein [Prolixibacteraceae bacterium]|nr:RagB/SusD family nutrient uptake outer membrane protein [Prolixibacteraceae bacterium]
MKKLYVYPLFCLLLVMFSCQDMLEVENKNGINRHNNFQTPTDLAVNIVGIYSEIQDIMPSVILFNGLRSDEMAVGETASPEVRSIYNYLELESNPFVDPTKFYKIIVNCNDFLLNAKVFEERSDEISLKNYQACVAEVNKIKYWCYWTIAKIYGEVYMFDEAFESDSEIEKLKEMKPYALTEVIPLLIKELDDPAYHWNIKINWQLLVDEPKTIYNYYGIEHDILLGDLLLWNKEYQRAASIFYNYLTVNSLTNGDLIGKDEDLYGNENYIKLYLNSVTTCSKKLISIVEYNHKFEQYNSLFGFFNRGEVIAGDGYLNISGEQYNTENSKGDLYRQFTDEQNMIWKYNFEKKLLQKPIQNRIILYKDSELYMKLIECLNEIGEYSTALALLNSGARNFYEAETEVFSPPFDQNKISNDGVWNPIWGKNYGLRQRVSLVLRKFPDGISDEEKKELLRQWILEENALEFSFEGKRFEDLMRFSFRDGSAIRLAQAVAKKYPEGERASIIAKLSDQNNWFWLNK